MQVFARGPVALFLAEEALATLVVPNVRLSCEPVKIASADTLEQLHTL